MKLVWSGASRSVFQNLCSWPASAGAGRRRGSPSPLAPARTGAGENAGHVAPFASTTIRWTQDLLLLVRESEGFCVHESLAELVRKAVPYPTRSPIRWYRMECSGFATRCATHGGKASDENELRQVVGGLLTRIRGGVGHRCHFPHASRADGILMSNSRVERWRGGLGRSLYSPLARPFVCECHNISTMLRFHLPLIKPDVRISRIRLSDKDSCVRPRNVAVAQAEFNKT